MTAEEIGQEALAKSVITYHQQTAGRLVYPDQRRAAMKNAIDEYNRTRWRLESAEHERRQWHQRELNRAATAK